MSVEMSVKMSVKMSVELSIIFNLKCPLKCRLKCLPGQTVIELWRRSRSASRRQLKDLPHVIDRNVAADGRQILFGDHQVNVRLENEF